MHPQLNLPKTSVRLKGDQIWDPLRKKYYVCTPEEWVRQHFVDYLINHKEYPKGRLVNEHIVNYNGMKKRCDIALFNDKLGVDVIVECKAPEVNITEDTFYQIAKYCHVLKASLLILTNGMDHYVAFLDKEKNELAYLKEIPHFITLQEMISA
jgi:hypothetical protein